MKKHCVRILSAFFGLAALAITAKSQTIDQIVVNIPHEFVVAGKTLPPGSYRVNRMSERNGRELVISNFENRETIFVLSTDVADRTGVEQPAVGFQRVGDQYVLSKIETVEHIFTVPVSKQAVLEVAMKKQSGSSVSGSSISK